jgi:hypothetical protein
VARVGAAFAGSRQEEIRTSAFGQLLFFHRQDAAAVPVLRELVEGAAPFGEDEFGWQLGLALAGTGNEEEAEDLLAVFPVVQPGQESLYYEVTLRRAAAWRENR